MRSLIMTVALAATLIAGAGSALAKGLSQATIEGPGITTPIRAPTGGDPQTGGPLNELAERARVFSPACSTKGRCRKATPTSVAGA